MFAEAGYQGVAKREEAKNLEVDGHIAMPPGKRRALDKSRKSGWLVPTTNRYVWRHIR